MNREAPLAKSRQRADSTSDSNAIAAATVETWRQIAAQLGPVIGARGVEVLFDRALHRIGAPFPWLATTENPGDSGSMLQNLKAQLASQPTAVATRVSSELFTSFTELLENLIGKSLTERLIAPVLALPSPTSAQGTAP